MTIAPKTRKLATLSRFWPFYMICLGLLSAWVMGLFDYLTLETLQAREAELRHAVDDNLLLSLAVYVCVYALATAFMIPGALWLTIAGGLLFGLVGGSLATIFGATAGAAALFAVARSSFGEALRSRAGPFMKRMESGFNQNPLSFMFAMRLMPVVPFPVANIAPALLGARFRHYVLTTALGIVPGVAAYTWVGASLGASLDPEETQNLLGVVGNFLPAFIVLGAVSLAPVVYKRFKMRPGVAAKETKI
jgi:uncharacterized membrane protein YdjX (TVP38/TMEM64 family)